MSRNTYKYKYKKEGEIARRKEKNEKNKKIC
jgi:hypothetical protein